VAAVCFDLVDRAYRHLATDADCAAFARDNGCKPVAYCGSLDCSNPACAGRVSGMSCQLAMSWGEANICQSFYAQCPCH
jgi:hypothetical protein